jgi:Zn ribbon nucleic-acid-binding protein
MEQEGSGMTEFYSVCPNCNCQIKFVKDSSVYSAECKYCGTHTCVNSERTFFYKNQNKMGNLTYSFLEDAKNMMEELEGEE